MDGHQPTPNDSSINSSNPNAASSTGSTPRQHGDATRVTTDSQASSNAPPPARVVGPFAAMVDAFISSFRQASSAQSNSTQSQNGLAQRQAPIVPPLAEPQVPSASSSAAPAPASNVEGSANAESQAAPNVSSPSTAQPNTASQQETPPPSSSGAPTDSTTPANNGTSETPRVLYFRMPFLAPNGQSATLAFSPGPIPVPANQPEVRPPYAANRQPGLGPERGNGLASGFHLPTAPIFVPHGTSPLPFSFIFDAQTHTAWPILTPANLPGAMPAGAVPVGAGGEPAFAAGPPFHIAIDITFGPPPQAESPDPERADRFVDSLERADAELRERMAKLGMGAIGDYGGRQDNEGGEGALGCGICLDEYPSEDRPEWIGGQASKDEEVVAVPCAGHHTLHRRCLYEWLAKTPPSEWTCPFCRAGLNKAKVESSAANASDDIVKKAEQEAKARSLREEVRLREKARGWRCDSPACLLRYPCKDDQQQQQADELVSLLPCRHKLHLDCLCTSMRLEQADTFEIDGEEEGQEEQEDDLLIEEKGSSGAGDLIIDDSHTSNTVGKWVTCPTCRSEAWAELPMKKRRRERKIEASTAATLGHEGDSTVEQQQGGVGAESVSKQASMMPTSGARERARLRDLERSARVEDAADDEDSDGAVEAILL